MEFDFVLEVDFRGLLNKPTIATFVVGAPTGYLGSNVRVIMFQHSRDVHVGAGLVLSVVIAIILVVVARFCRRPKHFKRLAIVRLRRHRDISVRDALLAGLPGGHRDACHRGVLPGDLRLVP